MNLKLVFWPSIFKKFKKKKSIIKYCNYVSSSYYLWHSQVSGRQKFHNNLLLKCLIIWRHFIDEDWELDFITLISAFFFN